MLKQYSGFSFLNLLKKQAKELPNEMGVGKLLYTVRVFHLRNQLMNEIESISLYFLFNLLCIFVF